PTNLLANGTFDSDFSGWVGFRANLTQSTTAHTGSHSAKVCLNTTPTSVYTIDAASPLVASPRAGQTYQASAWVRAVPGDTLQQDIGLVIRENPADIETFDHLLIDQTWRELRATFAVMQDGTALVMHVGGDATAAGSCFLTDDFTLVRLQ